VTDLLERTPVTDPAAPPIDILIPEARRRFRRRLVVVAIVAHDTAAIVTAVS
jgi:hypothetical protein